MLKPVLWIHGEALGPTNPALLAHPEAPAVFVFDRELIVQADLSLKRLGFLYECLLELPVTLRHGDVVEAVAEVEGDARVIIVGKRGEDADFAKGHLGSNLERIVRTSTRPVFVAARAFKPIARVLVAYDGGASAMKAVDHIARSPLFQGLAIHVVTVGAASAEVDKGLANAKAMLKAAGLNAETSVLPGQPEKALADLVETQGFDMLVMGAYGHSRIRSLVIGSTTTAMIRACKVPVVLMR